MIILGRAVENIFYDLFMFFEVYGVVLCTYIFSIYKGVKYLLGTVKFHSSLR